MSKSPAELRAVLMDCIDKVQAGTMSGSDAKAIAMLAGQMNLSLQVELNLHRAGVEIPSTPMLPSPGSTEEPTDVVTHPDPASLARHPWPGTVTRHRL